MTLPRAVARILRPLALLLLIAPLMRAPSAAMPATPGGDVITRVEAESSAQLPPPAGWQIVAIQSAPAHPDAHRGPRDVPFGGHARPDVAPRLRRSAPAKAARAPALSIVLQQPRSVRAPPLPG